MYAVFHVQFDDIVRNIHFHQSIYYKKKFKCGTIFRFFLVSDAKDPRGYVTAGGKVKLRQTEN